jgi:hypothetical protein
MVKYQSCTCILRNPVYRVEKYMKPIALSLLLIVYAVFPLHTRAAASEFKNNFGVYTGLSFPIKEFGESKTNVSLSQSEIGFADLGMSAGIKYLQGLGSRSFKWALDGSVILNSFDEYGFGKVFISQHRSELAHVEADKVTVHCNSWWVNFALLTGPWVEAQLSSDLAIYFSLLGGLYISRVPEASVAGYYGDDEVYIGNVIYSSETAKSFGMAMDFGLKYNLFTLGSRISYVKLNEVSTTRDANMFGAPGPETYKKRFPVLLIHIQLGFLYP